MSPNRSRLLLVFAFCAMCLAYASLTVYMSPEFRGSDQYWYVEDTTTIASGASAQTHETYPYYAAGLDERFEEDRSFVHDVPVLYLWAGVSKSGIDVHHAILLVNIVCAIASALLVYLTAMKFTSSVGALATSAFILFVPVGFWVTGQDMSEPFSGTLIALALWLVVRKPTRLGSYIAAVLSVALAAAGRKWALAFVLLIPLGLLMLDERRTLPRRLGRTALAVLAGMAAYFPLAGVFLSNTPLDVMVNLDIARNNNMFPYYRLDPPPPFDLSVALRKLASNVIPALRAQFSPSIRVFPITVQYPAFDRLPVNLAAFASFAGMFAPGADRLRRYVMGLGLGALASHLWMAVIFQNQPRYIVPVLAPLALGALVALDTLWRWLDGHLIARGLIVVLVSGVLASSVAIDVHNARDYRDDALHAAELRAQYDSAVETIVAEDARVVLDTRFSSRWPIDFALYPREVLSLATDFPYDEPTYRSLIDDFEATHLVVDGSSTLPEWLPVRRVGEAGGYAIFEFAP